MTQSPLRQAIWGPRLNGGQMAERYLDLSIEGLHDELRPDRPRTYEDDQAAEVINRAL